MILKMSHLYIPIFNLKKLVHFSLNRESDGGWTLISQNAGMTIETHLESPYFAMHTTKIFSLLDTSFNIPSS